MERKLFKLVILVALVILLTGEYIPCQAASSVTVNTFSELRTYLKDEKDYSITIGSNIEITGMLTVEGNKTIYGNGKCLFRGTDYFSGYVFLVQEQASLDIKSNLFLSGNSDNIKNPARPLFWVKPNATLKLGEKVNLYKNYSDCAGGAIHCEGTLYIQGANIYDCCCNTSGGAIQLQDGAICYMSSGRIYNNSVSECGGGIKQFKGSTFIISGGSIDNNTALCDGMGIHASGSLTLKGAAQINKNNDIYIAPDSYIATGDWSTPSVVALTTNLEIGKTIISNGRPYKKYFIWSDRQNKAAERPICSVGENLLVGAYYTINYHMDSTNQQLYKTQSKLYGTSINLFKDYPEVTGYSFEGWFTSPSGGSNVTGAVYETNANLNLYSRYAPNNYEVLLQSQNQEITRMSVQFDSRYGQLLTPTREGYTFTGWYLDEALTQLVSDDTIVQTASSHVLYAGWQAISCKVKFDATGGEVSIDSKQVAYEGCYGELPKAYREGYEFLGWYTDSLEGLLCDSQSKVMKYTEHILYARWKAHVYCVTWDPMQGKTSFLQSSVTYGNTYNTLPVVTKSGYYLEGWYTAPEGGSKCDRNTIVTIAYNHILYARWLPEVVPITSDKNSNQSTQIVPPVVLNKISITGIPCFYKENQSINTTKAKMVLEYSNKTKKTITKGWSIDSYKKISGQRKVVFRYQGKSCTLSCNWLSSKSINKIKPTKSVYTGYIGNKVIINFPGEYKGKLNLTYKTSNSKIVKVSKTGTMTLVKPGTAYITIGISIGNIKKTVKVKVVVKKPSLVTSYTYGEKWNQLQFKAVLSGSSTKPTYTTSNSKIAKIDLKTGKLTALNSGKVTVIIKVGTFLKKYSLKVNKTNRYLIIQ